MSEEDKQEEEGEEEDVEQLESIRSVSGALSGNSASRVIEYLPPGRVSRVIEYPPTGGDGAIARDCVNAGKQYSKGATTLMTDGHIYECTGDKDGSWKKTM